MNTCLRCGGPGAYSFRVLEVRTFHIRDMAGEKRVQALGKDRTYGVCARCAQERLDRAEKPGKYLAKKLAPYVAVLLFGAAVLAICWSGENTFRLLGGAGTFCGAAGAVSIFRAVKRERDAYRALPTEKARSRAAWDCLAETAPKKDGENDLTYIPIVPETLRLKNGDLAILYDLLPAIAKEAWDRLHSEKTSEPESK